MKYHVNQEHWKEAIYELLKDGPHTQDPTGVCIEFKQTDQEDLLDIRVSNERITVTAGHKTYFFRGLRKALQTLQEESPLPQEMHITEQANFASCGMMYDCSRNGVLKVDTIKSYIRKSAQLGMNTLMLYIEDTYELKEYPYFGYMRGRYTIKELKECDLYADQFGIEIIPCIQTLAHLHTPLRFPAFKDLKDTEDILLVGDDNVYTLIETMIRTISGCFRSKKIHLGMDEAHNLGLGEYLNQHGFTNRFEIMNSHLKRIQAICQTYHLEPAIWSDMYFSLLSPTGSYYDLPKDTRSEDIVKPPVGIELVYWDYYHDTKEHYKDYISLHRKMSDRISFVGGGWIWNGVAPNYSKMLQTTNAALEACKEEKISSVVCTLWQDNGAETPVIAGDPSMVLFAEHCFHKEVDMEQVKQEYYLLFHRKWEDTMLLDQFDKVKGTLPHNMSSDNPSKYLLYQDPMLGLFDGQIENCDMKEHYELLHKQLELLEDDGTIPLYNYYKTLARVLILKAELGLQIQNAYLTDNRQNLENIITLIIPECKKEVKSLLEYRRTIWYEECKSFGFEVLDIRLGGIIARLDSTKLRLTMYLNGDVSVLEELEEKRLIFREDTVNQEHTQCSCPYWQNIISAGNIAGI